MSTAHTQLVADRYRLVQPLGQGGMGRVWKARDEVLHRDVAIKELVPPPGLTADERREMRERSLREARAIARLNNINVVRVFDVLRTDADPWIVMEYVPSRSLQDVLAKDGPVSSARAVEIGLGVLGALRAAHRSGVMHRDVKPGNVLLGDDGRVVLTDFGLATVPGDPNVTRTGLVLGSPAYIAPERARTGSAGPEADMWSLGATLYAAVEGQSPYARPSAIGTLAALATEPPPPAKHAGPLKPVLSGLLRKDPALRMKADEAERLLRRASGKRPRVTRSLLDGVRRPSPLGKPREPRTPLLPVQRPPAEVSEVAPVSPPPMAALVTPPPPLAPPELPSPELPSPELPSPELPPTLTDAPPVASDAAAATAPAPESAPDTPEPERAAERATEPTRAADAEPPTAVVPPTDAPAAEASSVPTIITPDGGSESSEKPAADEDAASGTGPVDAASKTPTTADDARSADEAPAAEGSAGDARDGSAADSSEEARDDAAASSADESRDRAAGSSVDESRDDAATGGAGAAAIGEAAPARSAVDASGSGAQQSPPKAVAVAAVPRTSGSVAVRTGLRRDKRILGAAAAVVALLVLAVVVVLSSRSDDEGGQRAGGTSAATPTGAASAPAPQASATSRPSPTAAAPSAAQPTAQPTGAPEFVLPAGWRMHRDPTGFAVPIRDGWQVSRDADGRVIFVDPSGGRMLMIDQTDSPQPDPVADWKSKEDYRRSTERDYQRVGQIRAVDYGVKAADWEWLHTGDNGTRMHVRNRGFIAAKDKAYALYWETPESTWRQSLADYDVIARGFKPVRGKAA
ncbi:Serine/threonine protein kinase [Micromonospora pattaloongensis]|uniref:Serine/threonine protein kinase n=1 Tax=Micromonospora pattaloongensis TaxID=405436 RepID=A0A1H3GCV1_9ACTN|nr:serine/threonine-protein kinase [Micromonospora pattaloongensis]SDY00875.1 Serine/threonine protein kinase [Micromonospora pattaloongensis]